MDSYKIGRIVPLTEESKENSLAFALKNLNSVIAKRDELDDENRALRAHVERLRAGLDTARVEALWIAQNTAPSGTDRGDLSTNRAAKSMVAGIKFALAATPTQSLAAHDAAVKVAVLREMRNRMYYAQTWDEIANMLADEADRIEKEAENG